MRVKLFQEGGAMPAPQGGDPMEQLLSMAMQALQSNDGNIALQVCQMLVQLAQGGAPGAEAAAQEEQGEPIYRRGGKLIRRVR